MANKRASYVTAKNINKAQILMVHGATTTEISRIMDIPFNHATYLRTLVNKKGQTPVLKNLDTKSKVVTKTITRTKPL